MVAVPGRNRNMVAVRNLRPAHTGVNVHFLAFYLL